MGLLTNAGYPIAWDSIENPEAVKYVLEHGINQFLELYANYKDEVNKPFLWGDEVEYMLVVRDPQDKKVKLWLRAQEPLSELNKEEAEANKVGGSLPGLWRPEYASYMIEGTPAKPYSSSMISIMSCEGCLEGRLRQLKEKLPSDVVPLTLSNFPLMGVLSANGVADFTHPRGVPRGPVSCSLFVPDNVINPHPRFGTLTANIRKRRGKKVSIRAPLFMDENTQVDPLLNIDANPNNKYIKRYMDDSDDEVDEPAAKRPKMDKKELAEKARSDDLKPNVAQTMYFFGQYFDKQEDAKKALEVREFSEQAAHPSIYMDCMAFGMGCNCLQTTFQAQHIDQARHVYDQLAVLCPMMLALSAATPIHKGLLSEIDVRWAVISASVDDRKSNEVPRIMKSRYDTVSTYISTRPADEYFQHMNDIKLQIDEKVYQRLREKEIDHRLARHISHLFIRDPLVIYSGRLHQLEDARESDHFENIQSTNWQSMRFKPPPPKAAGTNIGWRVEFRMLECQLSNFENAAFMVFTIMLARAIIAFDLDFYIPLTKVDINAAQAHRRGAVLNRKFIMQKGISKLNILRDPSSLETYECTCDEIFNGNQDFEGLIPLVERYADSTKAFEYDGKPEAEKKEWEKARKRLSAYCELLRRKAKGTIKTTAQYIRDFVLSHPSYKKDSRVTPEIAYDLCEIARKMSAREYFPDDLLPREIVEMAGDL